jgi:hypothetical protein
MILHVVFADLAPDRIGTTLDTAVGILSVVFIHFEEE